MESSGENSAPSAIEDHDARNTDIAAGNLNIATEKIQAIKREFVKLRFNLAAQKIYTTSGKLYFGTKKFIKFKITF